MAKKIKGPGGECTHCHNERDLVLHLPSNPASPARLFYAKHDQLGGGRCPQSHRPVPMAYWPKWARDALKG